MADMHLDHCVNSIRQILMCAPNDAVFMYDWSPKTLGPVPRFKIEHECMNWDRLTDWAMSRQVDIYDTKAVVHPIYGEATQPDFYNF
jgi:hypothetical protein